MTAPTPHVVDHLRVAWLLVQTVLGVVPVLLWIAFSWILRPLVLGAMRRRIRRAPDPPAEPPEPDPAAWVGRTVFVVAGEASGDHLAARVVAALKARCPGIRVRGYAGPATAAAGAELDRDIVDHAVVGVTAVARSLGYWWRLSAETLARLRDDPPDVFFTVDFPGLNVRLARWARKRGVQTVHLVAPAVWAYAPWRIFRWRRAVDHLLTTFPFETVLFGGSGIPSTFVGHPLFEAPLPPPRTPSAWPGGSLCAVEVLPGSRRQEIRAHAPVLLEAAAAIAERMPAARFHVKLASPDHAAVFEEAGRRARARPPALDVVTAEAAQLAAERVGAPERAEAAESALPLLGALACSGTVTAELAAALVPMAVLYRLSAFARFGALVGLTAPWIALANLIAGERVVPERLQMSARGGHVAEDFLSIAATAAPWSDLRSALDVRVRRRIAVPDVADRAACALLHASRSALAVGTSTDGSRSPAGGPE